MFTGGAIIVIGIALDPDWPVVSAFDCAIMLKTVSTTSTWTSYTKVNIHCGEIKEATCLSLSNTVTHDKPTAMSVQSPHKYATLSV